MYDWNELVKIIFDNKKNLSKDVKQKFKEYLKTEESLLEFFKEDPYSISELFKADGFINEQSWEGERGYFGRSWNTIEDNETGLEFKESTRKVIIERFVNLGYSEGDIDVDDITTEIST